jgi:hypothetical protein
MRFLKHLTVILTGCLFAMSVFAQNATHTKKAPSGASSLSPERSKMLCKAWQLDTISEFGVANKAIGKEANDGITFVADGSFFITQEGVPKTGTWTYAASRINTVTTNPDNKLSFQIMSLADSLMVLEYQYPAPDLTRVQYIYSPKK